MFTRYSEWKYVCNKFLENLAFRTRFENNFIKVYGVIASSIPALITSLLLPILPLWHTFPRFTHFPILQNDRSRVFFRDSLSLIQGYSVLIRINFQSCLMIKKKIAFVCISSKFLYRFSIHSYKRMKNFILFEIFRNYNTDFKIPKTVLKLFLACRGIKNCRIYMLKKKIL